MIDKVKTMLSILLIVIIVFAVGYSIFRLISSAFEKPKLINSENISQYTTKENVTTNYSLYYNLNDCLNNFIQACNNKQYEELYALYDKDYIKQYTKEEVLAKLRNLKWSTEIMDDFVEYKLEYVYETENVYILQVKLNGEILYLLFNLNITNGYDYAWAFVK